MQRFSPDTTRANLTERNELLRQGLTIGAPTPEMLADYQLANEGVKVSCHKTNRGKHDLSRELAMTVSEFEGLMVGKKVLDIGCGEGKLSSDIARLKRTHVTALDIDPEVLSRVQTRNNLIAVQGSGIELPDELEDEKFDVVISSFSTVLWAESPEARQQAINVALRATRIGGVALIVPIISNPSYRKQMADSIIHKVSTSDYEELDPHQTMQMLNGLYTSDWMDVQAFDSLTALEDTGIITADYIPSLENTKGDPIQERISLMANIIGDITT